MSIRIRHRTSGSAGPPADLAGGELAFNEVDNKLYYGRGIGSDGRSATEIIVIGGAFVVNGGGGGGGSGPSVWDDGASVWDGGASVWDGSSGGGGGVSAWDGGATVWDGGASVWDAA